MVSSPPTIRCLGVAAFGRNRTELSICRLQKICKERKGKNLARRKRSTVRLLMRCHVKISSKFSPPLLRISKPELLSCAVQRLLVDLAKAFHPQPSGARPLSREKAEMGKQEKWGAFIVLKQHPVGEAALPSHAVPVVCLLCTVKCCRVEFCTPIECPVLQRTVPDFARSLTIVCTKSEQFCTLATGGRARRFGGHSPTPYLATSLWLCFSCTTLAPDHQACLG